MQLWYSLNVKNTRVQWTSIAKIHCMLAYVLEVDDISITHGEHKHLLQV